MQHPKKTVLVYVFDGFADWESSYVCAELHQTDSFEVKTVAPDRAPKRSMGGIAVMPDYALDNVPEEFAALLLIGRQPMARPDKRHRRRASPRPPRTGAGALVGGICNAASFWPSTASSTTAPTRATRSEYVQQVRAALPRRRAFRGSAGRRR